jgi:hypothetical protein
VAVCPKVLSAPVAHVEVNGMMCHLNEMGDCNART